MIREAMGIAASTRVDAIVRISVIQQAASPWHEWPPCGMPPSRLASSIFVGDLPQRLAKPAVIDKQREDGNCQDDRRCILSRHSGKRARQPGAQKRNQQKQ
ncbi:MAG: hypothetical protein V4796_14155 [Burkholderia cenocepacia]